MCVLPIFFLLVPVFAGAQYLCYKIFQNLLKLATNLSHGIPTPWFPTFALNLRLQYIFIVFPCLPRPCWTPAGRSSASARLPGRRRRIQPLLPNPLLHLPGRVQGAGSRIHVLTSVATNHLQLHLDLSILGRSWRRFAVLATRSCTPICAVPRRRRSAMTAVLLSATARKHGAHTQHQWLRSSGCSYDVCS